MQNKVGLAVALAATLTACGQSPSYRGWSAYGGGSENIKYSALDQVNRDNVGRLEVAWTYDSGDASDGSQIQCNPIIVNGVLYGTTPLIMGSRVSESLPAAPGDIRAYYVRTGEIRRTFHTVPRPEEFGYDTWPLDAWKHTGGVNNWGGMALDVERGIVFVPTGTESLFPIEYSGVPASDVPGEQTTGIRATDVDRADVEQAHA